MKLYDVYLLKYSSDYEWYRVTFLSQEIYEVKVIRNYA